MKGRKWQLVHRPSLLQECLSSLLLFDQLDASSKRKIASEMYERTVAAGDILIKEGDVGLAASELYVVKTGEFEVPPPA